MQLGIPACLVLFLSPVWGHEPDRAAILAKVDRAEVEISVNGGDLRLVNLYLLQARCVLDQTSSDSVVNRMIATVYRPYRGFWNILYKNEATFRALTTHYVLEEDPPISEQVATILDADVNAIFKDAAAGMIQHTGYRPKGAWHLIWGTGQFDIGVPAPGVAILDWAKQQPTRRALEILFPHELSHLIHRELAIDDPDSGSALDWIIAEGFATYVSFSYWRGKYSEAACLQYQDSEWTWALAHEDEIKHAARKLLFSRSNKDAVKFKSGSERLLEGGPTRMGYFIGFRIVQAYVAKKGADAWKRIYRLPVKQVMEESDYFD